MNFLNKPPFYLLIVLCLCCSCDNEPVDFEPFEEETQVTTGDYWPMALNNTWTYNQELNAQPVTSSTISMTGTEVINGIDYFEIENFSGTEALLDNIMLENLNFDTFTRQEGDNYFIRLGELTAEIPNVIRLTQQGYEYTLLRDEDEIGTTFTETFEIEISFESLNPLVPDPSGITANYMSRIETLERDMTLVVNGETFSPVIKVQQVLTVDFSNPMFPNAEITNDYYFAFDVGIIRLESIIRDADGSISSTQNLNLTTFDLN